MASRENLQIWIVNALRSRGGQARMVKISRSIWENHERDLMLSGELFYTWQYEMCWAGQILQKRGQLRKFRSPRNWQLSK